jgi:uncharacterized membrane protein (UPF0127 family)
VNRARTIGAVVALLVVVATGLVAGGVITPAPFDGGPASTPTDGTATPTATVDSTATPTPDEEPDVHAAYEQATVTAVDADTGEALGTVEAAIADNHSLRYTGLSETDALPEDRGMLFTYDSEDSRTYVMRNMSFGIDIVFVDANRTVTTIHHAPEPDPDEDGNEQRYPGTGQYVLEVNYGWTTDHGVEAGDRLEFELPE